MHNLKKYFGILDYALRVFSKGFPLYEIPLNISYFSATLGRRHQMSFRCHPFTGFRNIRGFHNFPADQNYRVLLPSTNTFDVESPDKLFSILHLSRDHRRLYFTNSGVVCLSRPRVPARPLVRASPSPTSSSPRVPRPRVPESHVLESPSPTSSSPRVPRPQTMRSHSSSKAVLNPSHCTMSSQHSGIEQ